MFETSVLYRTNDKNQTVQWRSWARETEDGDAVVGTEHGHVGGLLQSSEHTYKANTRQTAYERAKHTAQKKWEDKQRKEGYTQSLETSAAAQHRDDMGGEVSAVYPMLASTLEKNFSIDKPHRVQPKIDGFRCMARVGSTIELYSRTNKPYIGFESMRTVLSQLPLPDTGFGSGQLYLDGEFYIEGVGFNDLSGKIKRGQHHASHDIPEMRYWVFDCVDLNDLDAPFETRLALLEKLLPDPLHRVALLPTPLVHTTEEVREHMRRFMTEGHEGLMLRDPDSPYVLRKRSKHLQKLKEFVDAEFKIVGYKEAGGNDKGTVVWICATIEGMEFSVRPIGTREHRAALLEHAADHMGRWLTVKYQELSEDGVPRFPVGKAIREAFDHEPTATNS